MSRKPDEIPETSLPQTFAIVKDGRRRGGWRVARCRVLASFGPLHAANVREIRTRVEHWRPLDALAKHPRRAGRMLRDLLRPKPAISAAPEEAQSAAVDSLAGTAGAAGETPPQWWQRD